MAAVNRKPLPAPPSPTLTNPDMVLPDVIVEEMDLPETGGPPSPSYLQISSKKPGTRRSRNNLRSSPRSPAYGSSPTLDTPLSHRERRRSFAASSINSDDLEAMQIPEFASLDSDTDTIGEDEFDIGTPSEISYGANMQKRNEAEQSSSTLMRAELILANAKKRLNMMDQNLRGAREIVAPLTAANLKRATSLSIDKTNSRYSQPSHLSSNHMRVLSNPEAGPDSADRPYSSLARVMSTNSRQQGPLVNKSTTPSWTLNPLRGSRSSEGLRVSSRATPEPSLGPLLEDGASQPSVTPVSSAQDLREQMLQLRGRISNLKERAQKDNLQRRSMMDLKGNCPLNNAQTPPPKEPRPNLVRVTKESPMPGAWISSETIPARESHSDGSRSNPYSQGSDSTERQTLPTTEDDSSEPGSSEYEDAPDSPPQRHEDREDAFDYSKFFLHSATGSFSRPRGSSVSSEDSANTARGPAIFDSVPPTPETPETLRNIELQHMHKRTISSESVATVATFETAQEAIKTPASIADWLARSNRADRADSRLGSDRSRPRPAVRISHQPQTYVSLPPSPAATAVSALLDPEARPLGLKDKALVFTLVESLKTVCEQLQAGHESEYNNRVLRRRLDEARRALDGSSRSDS